MQTRVFKQILSMAVGDHLPLSDVVKESDQIEEATVWRTRSGWELRTRAKDGTYGTKLTVSDVTENNDIFDKIIKMVDGAQGFPDLPFCPCGCGNKSTGGRLLRGHRERARDNLNRDSSKGDRLATRALLSMPPEWYDDDALDFKDEATDDEINGFAAEYDEGPEEQQAFEDTENIDDPAWKKTFYTFAFGSNTEHGDALWNLWSIGGSRADQLKHYGLDLRKWQERILDKEPDEVFPEDAREFNFAYNTAENAFLAELTRLQGVMDELGIEGSPNDMTPPEIEKLYAYIERSAQHTNAQQRSIVAVETPSGRLHNRLNSASPEEYSRIASRDLAVDQSYIDEYYNLEANTKYPGSQRYDHIRHEQIAKKASPGLTAALDRFNPPVMVEPDDEEQEARPTGDALNIDSNTFGPMMEKTAASIRIDDAMKKFDLEDPLEPQESVVIEPAGASNNSIVPPSLPDLEQTKEVVPFPDLDRCRCSCGGSVPLGTDYLPGHRSRMDDGLFDNVLRGDEEAEEYVMSTGLGRREFNAFIQRRHEEANGSDTRVDGDEAFSEEDLAFNYERVPDGLPLEWVHAPLFDPGPGTPQQQVQRLTVRRDRATTPTEIGLLNAALDRMSSYRTLFSDDDLDLTDQMSNEEVEDYLARSSTPIGQPVSVFLRNTGLVHGSFRVQRMVSTEHVNLASGQGNLGIAHIVNDQEVMEHVEQRLKEMGAEVGESSLEAEEIDEERESSFQTMEGPVMSVWVDLGEGKHVEFFPQVTNLQAMATADTPLVSEDRFGSVDRTIDFGSDEEEVEMEEADEEPVVGEEEDPGVDFRGIPWSRRNSFEFTDMTAQEIENFLVQVFPDAEREAQIANVLVFNDMNNTGVPMVVQHGFADGTVVPDFDSTGLIHKSTISPMLLESLFSTWGLMSKSERKHFERAATRDTRPGMLKPDALGVSMPEHLVSKELLGLNSTGDFSAGLDGYMFANWGTSAGYDDVTVTFHLDPIQMMRDDVVFLNQDASGATLRFREYGQFAKTFGVPYGQAIPPEAISDLSKNKQYRPANAEEVVHLHDSAEANIPLGVPWSQVTRVTITDANVYSSAARAGYVRGRFNSEADFALRRMMIKLKSVAPHIVVSFENEFDKEAVKQRSRMDNQESGCCKHAPTFVDVSGVYSMQALNKYASRYSLVELLGVPGETLLSDVAPNIVYHEITLADLEILTRSMLKYVEHNKVKPAGPLELLIKGDNGEILYDFRDVDFTSWINPEGHVPGWFTFDIRNYRSRMPWGAQVDYQFTARVLGDLWEREAMRNHPMWDNMNFVEKTDWLTSIPFLAYDHLFVGDTNWQL